MSVEDSAGRGKNLPTNLGRRSDLRQASWIALLRLVCPYCKKQPLRKGWFLFRDGCSTCDYRFEREDGYWTGASWMVNFPTTSLVALAVGGTAIWLFANLDPLVMAAIAATAALAFGILFVPFANALWMGCEHVLHPLTEEDRLSAKANVAPFPSGDHQDEN